MRRVPVIAVGMALVLAAAGEAAAQRNKTTCGSDVGLTVAIAGTQGAPGGHGLVSDGVGAYRNGTKGAAKVTAIFQVDNCTHDFTLNVSSSTRSMWALLTGGDVRTWFFNLDRVHSVPITPETQSESESFATGHAFCTGGIQRNAAGQILKGTENWYYDNYGGCGVDELGRAFVRRAGGFSTDPDGRLSFRISPIDRPARSCDVNPTDPACSAS